MAIKKHLDYKENNLATIIKSISRLKPDKVLFCFIIWLAPRAGKMSQILRCDWLPERARWSYLARSGLPVARPLGMESLIPGNNAIFLRFSRCSGGEILTKMFGSKLSTFS